MGQSKLVQGQAGSFWHTKEMNIELMNFNCCITNKGHPPFSLIQNPEQFYSTAKPDLDWKIYLTWQNRFMLQTCTSVNNCERPCRNHLVTSSKLPSGHLGWRLCELSWSWAGVSALLRRTCACGGRTSPGQECWTEQDLQGQARSQQELG